MIKKIFGGVGKILCIGGPLVFSEQVVGDDDVELLRRLHEIHAAGIGELVFERDITVTPMHEGLRVDVLVVLHEVQTALERFVDDSAIVAARQTQFRLSHRCLRTMSVPP